MFVLRLAAPLFSISTLNRQLMEPLIFCNEGPPEFELIEDVELKVELVLVSSPSTCWMLLMLELQLTVTPLLILMLLQMSSSGAGSGGISPSKLSCYL